MKPADLYIIWSRSDRGFVVDGEAGCSTMIAQAGRFHKHVAEAICSKRNMHLRRGDWCDATYTLAPECVPENVTARRVGMK